ncbi:immunity-related GTPase family Q protein [Echinops telfairi]|uniref:Immunity-related GTPase family Q protein n=1 Tax=Echinops telfairi TaxID=9371 RepID=A0ABM0IYA4_ECHTE|nr:immunity-related GTPase family Q protein [Echinops telfairi]
MPPPRGDVTALFLGPPGTGKSALIAALCDKDVETLEPPEGPSDSRVPSLRAAGPGLFLGELSCPPAVPGPWAAEANVLVLVLPGPEGNGEVLAPALGEAARAALARGTPLLAVRTLRAGSSQDEGQAREQTAALLDCAGLGAVALFVVPTDRSGSPAGEELERLRAAVQSQAEALQRLLPPAQDGFEVLGAAELEAVREAFETGGLEAALSWVRAGLERLGSARVDLAVAGAAHLGLVLDLLLGLDPGDPGAAPASAPADPTPYPAPERPNVVLWTVPLDPACAAATPQPTHFDAVILVTPGAPTEKDWAQARALVPPDGPLVCVRTDGEGEEPMALEGEEMMEKPSGGEGIENRAAGASVAGSDDGLPQIGAGTASGTSISEDETWEVLEEAQPPVFPLRQAGLPGLCAWLRRALPPGQAGALLLALPPSSPSAARTKARLGAWAGEGRAGGAALGALSFLWPAGGAAATGGLGYRAAHGVLLQALDEMLADAQAVLAFPSSAQ